MRRNLRKAICLTSQEIYADGAFSSYYKYNSTQGIKTFYSDGHKTIKSLITSRVWRRATKENKLLVKCKERYENIPKAYGVYPIKISNKYYPGILMQHITGNTLAERPLGMNSKDIRDILRNIERKLRKVGIEHEDVHKENVIYNNIEDSYYVIDFTYDLIHLNNGYNSDV